MIIEKNNVTHDVVEGDFITVKSSINKSKLNKLYGMLSNIYRNVIGSIVREYASNAYDANIEADNFKNLTYEQLSKKYSWINEPKFNMTETKVLELKSHLTKAGKDQPVIVGTMVDVEENEFFYVKDYGVGLSPERIQFIYFNFLDSTKEDTDDEIGGFGIGCKSGLAYHHTLFIDTVYNGTEYRYIMTKDKEGIPQGQLLLKIENSTLDNGTTIRIPIKDSSDSNSFNSEIAKQLTYMHNIYWDNNPNGLSRNGTLEATFNKNKIYGNDNWKICNNPPFHQFHISLNNITYSIDWTELGMNSINYGLALCFKTGELQPTPSRESIIYSKHSIAVIKERIKLVQDYFMSLYKDQNQPTTDFKKYIDNKYTVSTINLPDTDITIPTQNIFGIAMTYSLEYKPFKDVGILHRPLLFDNYYVIRSVNVYDGSSTSLVNSSVSRVINNGLSFYTSDGKDKIYSTKNYFICENLCKNDFYIIRRRKTTLKEYKLLLHLTSKNKSKWREMITVYQNEIDEYVKSMSLGSYSDIIINPNWYKDFRNGNSKYSPKSITIKNKGEIACRVFDNHVYGNSSKTEVSLDMLKSYKGLAVYGGNEDSSKIIEFKKIVLMFKSFRKKNNPGTISDKALILFTTIKTNIKILKDMENVKSVHEIIDEQIKPFMRLATCMKIRSYMKDMVWLQNNIKHISDRTYDEVSKIVQYYNSNIDTSLFNSNIFKAILKVSEKNNYFDNDIINRTIKLVEYNKKVPLLKLINRDTVDSIARWEIAQYIKSNKQHINIDYYAPIDFYLLKYIIENSKCTFQQEYYIE